MRILGIDPGLQRTGYGCVQIDHPSDQPQLIEAGVIRLKSSAPIKDRLVELADELDAIITDCAPARMAVEEVFSHAKHVRTSILMGHARGVVLLAAARRSLEIGELAPNAIKKAITGHGHATKLQMQHAVRGMCGLDRIPEPSDVADAIGIAICEAHRLFATAEMPTH